uniref:Uncharacterized protein n=1 Tax=Acrobeloides nanus TaxID=290746 RepID=A0A914CNL5_9BILA
MNLSKMLKIMFKNITSTIHLSGLATKFANTHFNDRAEVHQAVVQYIALKASSFFRDGINQLVDRWNYVIDHDGDYYDE